MPDDPPDSGVPFTQDQGRFPYQHELDQRHGEALEEQGEAAAFPVPGNLPPRDRGTGPAESGRGRRLVLEEVHVPPQVRSTVSWTGQFPLSALGAGPAAPRKEVDKKIHLTGIQVSFDACQSPLIPKI